MIFFTSLCFVDLGLCARQVDKAEHLQRHRLVTQSKNICLDLGTLRVSNLLLSLVDILRGAQVVKKGLMNANQSP